MKRQVFFILLIDLMILQSLPLSAQFTIDALIRPRTEYRHGYKTLAARDGDPAFFTSQRSRLNFGFKKDIFNFYVSIQDVRTWGSTSQLNLSDGFNSLHEAWASVKISEAIEIKLGRQEVVYDDHRIFGNVDWAQQGRSHDMAKILISLSEKTEIHLGLAYNQDKEQLNTNFYTIENNYKTLQYLWFNNKWDKLSLSLVLLNNGMQFSDTSKNIQKTVFSQTLGGFVQYTISSLKLEASSYYQTGKDGGDRDLGAYQIMGNLKYGFPDGNFEPFLGVELMSGTDEDIFSDPLATQNSSFTPFYGTNHKFNGHMDYFYVGNHLNNVGLADIFGGLNYKSGRISYLLGFHQFSSHALLNDPDDASMKLDRSLGQEVDLALKFTQSDVFSLMAGYSQMFASPAMEALKGGDADILQNWAWFMFIFSPTLHRGP